MSILLDAVTRNSQQTQAVTHDVVLTPRAQYKAKRESARGLLYAAVFVCLALLMVVAAWLLTRVVYPTASLVSTSSQVESIKPTSALNMPQIQSASLSNSLNHNETNHLAIQSNEVLYEQQGEQTEIRLAGKVALPLAQPLAVTQAAKVTHSVQTTNNLVDEQPGDLMAALLKAQQSVEQGRQPVSTQADSKVSSQVNSQASEQTDLEPIILGANSNQRGNELLASLKHQVEDAANDVGLKSTEVADNNNLLAAFEAALKDVERDNSVATPVTEPKLDPIPATPKSDDIPKYGQLPAGLQLQVPEFSINAHVYSTAPDNRWLNVDGAELQEGDSIQGKLTIVEIRPRDVVLAIQGSKFKVPAI
ncbi:MULTISPECIES: general secretion pathway protein GspB [unclassified Shewanella]|uniref:general secretion pathway protein GspB n=1 Tax=unclassified Shewanella TaxID=196818 RepID=UPI001BC03BF6|nr:MULTISPECIES: general secretion pathway protein GspB [unclassified Shewanella]GIU21463.1 general secretion pathway protein GspB [Shewanella sp. MBTL60-112-B1]GIU33484.1 general secretion pathway protein GspB [Shewanella sp. MBTL60-112-B2]